MSKNVLITGGAGFIGSNLSKFLLSNNYNVICLDNFQTGKKNNIECLLSNDRFKLIEHDIKKSINISEDIDYIFNLACPASPEQYQKNPIDTMKTSVFGLYNTIDIALKNSAFLIHASTSEIYGDPLVHPQSESYWGNVNTIGVRSCYVESKRCCESILSDFHRFKNLKVSIVRIFNTYGPNMDKNDGRVISNFINNSLNKFDIQLYGNGEQTRSFCYIDDLICAFHKLMDIECFGPINIGSPDEISIVDLAHKIKNILKTESKIVFKDIKPDDPSKRKPDISKAISKLGWEPKTSLDEGLKLTIEYFENQR